MDRKQIILLSSLLLWLSLSSFVSLAHASTYTLLDETVILTNYDWYSEFSFDLPAGDVVAIQIEVLYGGAPVNFYIENSTATVYEILNILSLDDLYNVPADDSYVFILNLADEYSTVHIMLGSELIPEFPTLFAWFAVIGVATLVVVWGIKKLGVHNKSFN